MLLLVKLLLVPLLIAAITVAGQRLGPRVAGALTGLPVVAGPIALFMAIEQGAAFGAHAALGALAGQASLATFCVLYARAAPRASWWWSLAIAWTGFAAVTLVLQAFDIPLAVALVLALVTPLVVRRLTPQPATLPRGRRVARGEIALRMLAGVVLVLALTGVADVLGPRLSGLLTVFPVAATVLAVFSHRGEGAAFAIHLLRGLAAGLYSLTAFFTTLALCLTSLDVATSFVAAALASLVAQVLVLQLLERRTRTGVGAT